MGRIPEEIVQQIIDASDIVDLVSSYVPLNKAGRNFKALSPFTHEKTASFIVSPDKQIFKCFSSGKGGNVVTFVMEMEKLEFPDAIRFLGNRVGIVIPEIDDTDGKKSNIRQQLYQVNQLAADFYHHQLISGKDKATQAARDYLKNRGVEVVHVQQFKLGFALDQWDSLINYLSSQKIPLSLMEKAGLIIPRDNKQGYYDRFRQRIIFPIFDTQSHCRAFGARAMDNSDAKYINSPETPVYTKGHHLYGFHLTKHEVSKIDHVIIVEGYLDCIVPYHSGINNIVASLGTALTVEQIRLLRRYTKNIIMLFDSDKAGQAAIIRSLDTLVEEGMSVKVASLEEGEDPDSFVRKYGPKSLQDKVIDSQTLFDYKLSYLMKRYDSSTLEGKAKISSEILPTIDKFENAILRSGYIERLSRVLSIPQAAVLAELKKVGQVSSEKKYSTMTEVEQTKVKKVVRAAEENILKLLLEDEKFIQPTKNSLELSDIQDEDIRTIISRIFELSENCEQVNVSQIINSFKDQAIQQLIAGYVAQSDEIPGDREKMHREIMGRIKQDRLKIKRTALMQQIQKAEHSGDNNKLDQLKKEFNDLIKS